MLLLRLRNRHFLALDLLLLAFMPTLALILRVDVESISKYIQPLILVSIFTILVKIPVFYTFGLYRRYWRYASIGAMIDISSAATITTIIFATTLLLSQASDLEIIQGFPRSIPFIDGLLTIFLIGGLRFSVRMIEHQRTHSKYQINRKHVLIAGAGDAGVMILREILNSDYVTRWPVGFVDDDPSKQGTIIHNTKVLGPLRQIPDILRNHQIEEVIIAMPTAPGKVIRQVVEWCTQADVPYKTLPGIYELISGQAQVSRVREVGIEDLLRREPVQIDASEVSEMIQHKRVLITGAGGSIGSELCRQILQYIPGQLITLGHGENSLFELKNNLNLIINNARDANLGQIDIQTVVADIRDHSRLQQIFERYQPHLIFHAAAHKHVPLMEGNLEDAITNNVLGTLNLVTLAEAHNVQRLVLISSDKAVNPVNIMGVTKRIAELIVQQAAYRSNRPFVAVRFGNVLGSRGSVVPFFKRQIANGGPVTITHPNMTRFFMTIPEAVQLVLQAGTMGQKGDIFVLDMGEPVKIIDLARDLIELSGLKVGDDIEIKFVGLRPGEKLYEELFAAGETHDRTRHQKIFMAHNGMLTEPATFEENLAALIEAARRGHSEQAQQLLGTLVSEYNPNTISAPPLASLP